MGTGSIVGGISSGTPAGNSFSIGGTALRRVYKFHGEEIVEETRQKEAGFEVPLAAEILWGFPEGEFRALKWKTTPRWEYFLQD